MSQLGERLRTARESQGIGLAQAAAETRILQRYLVSLEDGDFQHLPGDVYARGFIRNYGAYLGLPTEELIELYRHERGMSEPIRVVPATAAPRARNVVLPSFFGVFFVVLILVTAAYLAANFTNQFSNNQSQAANIPTPAPTPSPLPTPAPNATPLPSAITGATSTAGNQVPTDTAGGVINLTPTVQPTPEAPIVGEVRIAAGDNPGSWLSITQDGVEVYAKVLGPGQSFQILAQRSVSVRAGNAGVVTVIVNGQELCCVNARSGEVRTVSWPP